MAVYFAHDNFGGFVVGDTDTGMTCYAYWSSVHADRSVRHPADTARHMLERESASMRRASDLVRAYDARNWDKLAALVL